MQKAAPDPRAVREARLELECDELASLSILRKPDLAVTACTKPAY